MRRRGALPSRNRSARRDVACARAPRLLAAGLIGLALSDGNARADRPSPLAPATAPSRPPDPQRAIAALPDGAPLYVTLQPVAFSSLARLLGLAETAEVKQLALSLGVDPLDPAPLAAAGIDTGAPVAAALFRYDAKAALFHQRIALPIVDAVTINVLLAGASSTGQLPLEMAKVGSPLAQAGVRATLVEPGVAVAILRVSHGVLLVDVALPALPRAHLPSPLALAEQTPIEPARRFAATLASGARQLFTVETAAALYLDGRALPSLAAPLAELPFEAPSAPTGLLPSLPSLPSLGAAPPAAATGNAGLVDVHPGRALARRRAAAPRCQAELSRAPATFDDLAIALAPTGDGVDARLAWGAGDKATGLALHTADDGALAPQALAPFATAVLSWRALSFAPLLHLPRPTPLRDLGAMRRTFDDCPALALSATAVRHWPQLLAAAIADATGAGAAEHSRHDGDVLGSLLSGAVAQVRNVDVLIRDAGAATSQLAAFATVGPAARPLVELLLAAGDREVARYGQRAVRLYALGEASDDGSAPSGGLVAVEDLPAGTQLVGWATGRETLDWAFAAGRPSRIESAPPLLALRGDGARLARALRSESPDAPPSPWLDLLARTRAVEGTLRAGRELVELRLHAAFPPQRPPSAPPPSPPRR